MPEFMNFGLSSLHELEDITKFTAASLGVQLIWFI
jgi:hypothetical protein